MWMKVEMAAVIEKRRRDAAHDSGIGRPLFDTGPSLDMLHPR